MNAPASRQVEELGRDMGRYFGLSPKLVCRTLPHGAIVLSGFPTADLNYVVLTSDAQAAELQEALEAASVAEVNAILIIEETAEQICRLAEEAGAAKVGQMPLMRRAAAPVSLASGPVARLARPEDIDSANRAMADAFSLELAEVEACVPAAHYAGESVDLWIVEEDREVAGCGAFIREGDRVGIYAMATAPDHRRKGVGTAVLAHAMAHYQDAGVSCFTLGATEQGFPLYEKAGFAVSSQPFVFVIGHSTQFPGD